MASLGGTAMFVDQSQSRLDAREKLSDIAHNLERWIDVIVLRTFAQETIEGMAQHASVPVINALSDLEHPCQALADYFTLQERFGDLKKITLAYVGDGNNVAHSLLLTCACLGSSIRIATPEGLRAAMRRSWPTPERSQSKRARNSNCSRIRMLRSQASMRFTPTHGPAWDRKTKPHSAHAFSSRTRSIGN